MSKVSRLITGVALSLTLLSGAVAQDHHDDHSHDRHSRGDHNHHNQERHNEQHEGNHYVHHGDWRRGHRLNHDDWARGERVDYRQHHLRRPRRGYEWRQVDGNYVLAAVTTGLIASVLNASSVR